MALVDEAHNFRSPTTRRYRALFDYLWSGEHKTILLSATPQNLGPSGIYHQLRLFLDDLDQGLNLELLHLQEYFKAVQRWYAYRIERENWQQDYARWQIESGAAKGKKAAPPAEPARPSVPYADIQEVLGPVFLRRRRKDIKELYGEDITISGKPVRFPEPILQNLVYRLDKVYAKAETFADIEREMKRHRGARYLALDYLKAEARRKELRRYLSRQLRFAHEAAKGTPVELARIGVLQQIFLDHLPNAVLAELNEVRRMELTGSAFVRRLDALRERHRLNPPDSSDASCTTIEVMRIVCSDGLV